MRNGLWRALSGVLAALCGVLFGLWAGAAIVRAEEPDPLAVMRAGGNLLLVRHAATEPGIGDPPAFRLGDCSTQRNLSEAGRADARRMGERLRAEGVPVAQVRASRWCRGVETARLAFEPGLAVMEWAAIDSLHGNRAAEPRQTREVFAALAALPADSNWVWVTHQANISALTGTPVAMGEVLVVRPENGRLRVLARWRP